MDFLISVIYGLARRWKEYVGRGGYEVTQDDVYESRARPPRRRVSIGQPEFEASLLSPEGVDDSPEGSGGKGEAGAGGVSWGGGFWTDMWGERAGRRRRPAPGRDHGASHEAQGSEDDREAMLASSGPQGEASRTVEDEFILLQDEYWRQQQDYLHQSQQVRGLRVTSPWSLVKHGCLVFSGLDKVLARRAFIIVHARIGLGSARCLNDGMF